MESLCCSARPNRQPRLPAEDATLRLEVIIVEHRLSQRVIYVTGKSTAFGLKDLKSFGNTWTQQLERTQVQIMNEDWRFRMKILSSFLDGSVQLESLHHPLPHHPPHAGDDDDDLPHAGDDGGGEDDENPHLFFVENNVAADDNADDSHVESTLWYADKGSLMTMIKRPYVRSTPSLLITMIKIKKNIKN